MKKVIRKSKNATSPAEAISKRKHGTIPVNRTKLTQMRTALGLTSRDIEEATRVSNSQIDRIETGYIPNLFVARVLAKFFGTTVDELFPEDFDYINPKASKYRKQSHS